MTSRRIRKPGRRSRLLQLFLLLLFPNELLQAATITVTSLADNTTVDGQVTLREALEAANLDVSVDGSAAGNGADQIVFGTGPGTITLGGTALPTIVDDLSITGLGAGELTVDGADQSRIFHVLGGVTAQISDLAITRGRSTFNGAGIVNHGTLSLSNSVLSANATEGDGGGLYSTDTLTLTNSTFSGNSALNGAGIYNEGTATITNSTFANNFNGGIAPFVGGGGGILNANQLTIVASTFYGNIAGNGGGILNSHHLQILNSTLSGNEALNSGGGLSTSGFSSIVNSTFTANRSNTNNDAFGSGGGMSRHPSSTGSLHSSIVAGNFNGTGAVGSDIEGPVLGASSFNLVGTSAGLSGITHGTNGNLVGTPASPIDPLLGPLADNGGLTLTHALLSGSPAIDNGGSLFCQPTDQRGFLRPYDGDGDGIAVCDIGALELASCLGAGASSLGGKASKMYSRRTTPPAPFRNLMIRLVGADCADTAMTDGQGRFLFENLAEGTYTVAASEPTCRFKQLSWTVTIAEANARVVFYGLCP